MTEQPPQDNGWPPLPSSSGDLEKILYAAQVNEAAEARRKANSPPAANPHVLEIDRADRAAERELDKLFQQSMFDVYKSSLDRAQSAAELVQKSAAAVGTIYAGLLALAFSVTANPLPARATVPGIFLGLAIVFSTGYLAYRWRPTPRRRWKPHSAARENQIRRLQFFGQWVSGSVNRRSYALRASVLALGFGVAFLPLPFLAFNEPEEPPAVSIPSPPPVSVDDPPGRVELLRLQYQAELEAAKERAAEVARSSPRTWNLPALGDVAIVELVGWTAAVAGLGVVLLVPLVTRGHRDSKRTADKAAGSSPGTGRS